MRYLREMNTQKKALSLAEPWLLPSKDPAHHWSVIIINIRMPITFLAVWTEEDLSKRRPSKEK